MLLAGEPALSPLQGSRTPVTVRTNQLKLDACGVLSLHVWWNCAQVREKEGRKWRRDPQNPQRRGNLVLAARERLSQESLLEINSFPGLVPVNYLWLILWASGIFISGGRSKSSPSCASCWKSMKIQLGSACETNLRRDSGGIASFPGTQKAFEGFDT